jgi:hypothetical protein
MNFGKSSKKPHMCEHSKENATGMVHRCSVCVCVGGGGVAGVFTQGTLPENASAFTGKLDKHTGFRPVVTALGPTDFPVRPASEYL